MAWTAPMTAVAGATFAAAQFNAYVRDNLNETAPAKATAASQLFVSTGPNAIATRVPTTASIATLELLGTQAYSDLATPGPMVTVATGTIAIVSFAAALSVATSDTSIWVSAYVSGASTVLPSDAWSIQADGISGGNYVRYGMTHVFTGLTPGTNTFGLQYKAGASMSYFRNREISVIPL